MAKQIKQVALVTKNLNKKGTLKGKNKKETKYLKAICTSHKYNKKGTLKPTIINNGDGTCICSICGERFPANFFSKDNMHETMKDVNEITAQLKYMAVSTNAGPAAVDYICQTSAMLSQLPKMYKKVHSVAAKQSKNNNNRKKKHSNGSSQYGSWGTK